MKCISEEKEKFYKTIQEEIATTNSSIRRVCMLNGMSDFKAYRHWLSKQKEIEEPFLFEDAFYSNINQYP